MKPFFFAIVFIVYKGLTASGQQLVVKSVSVENKDYKYSKDSTIFLTFKQKSFSVEFYPLNQDSALIAYRILDLDTTWLLSSYPVFNVYGLSGGEYLLEAKVISDNYENEILKIPVKVEQTFWQKWWFWPSVVVYILAILGIGIYLFFLYDFRQKLKMQYVRNKIASDLHDEVGSNLNSIAIFTELLRKKEISDPTILPILDRISSNSEETVSLMRDTVWAINPNNDSLEKLIEKMRSFGLEILTAKNIDFYFEVSLALKPGEEFTMEQRRNLYLIFKEAINNIAKHSFAKKAICEISKEAGTFKVCISDDGMGFDPKSIFEGNGLKNFFSRSEEGSLQVSVVSELGKGTTITIEVYE